MINGVEGKPFRITGITFDGTGLPNAGAWAGEIVISGNCKNFRVDHCKFLNMDQMMTISGDTYGLIDHCYFHALEKKGGQACRRSMYHGPGKVNYRKPLTLGTADAVYFEDNEVHFSPEVVNPTGNNPWIVPYNGARTVIRHNKIVNSQLEIYRPAQGQGPMAARAPRSTTTRSPRSVKKGRPQGFIFIGAGVAIVFNNTVTGTTYNCRTITLHERSGMAQTCRLPQGRRHEPHRRQSDSRRPARGRLSVLRPGRPGNERRRQFRAVALLRLEQHPQWGEAAAWCVDPRRIRTRRRRSRKGGISSTRSRRRDTTSPTSIRIRCKRAGKR